MFNFLKKGMARKSVYFLTWGLELQHGGMTAAMLNRAKALNLVHGVDIKILTLAKDSEINNKFDIIKERYDLSDAVTLLNIWDYYIHKKYPCFNDNDSEVILQKIASFSKGKKENGFSYYSYKGKDLSYFIHNSDDEICGYGVLEELKEIDVYKGGKIWDKNNNLIVEWSGHWQLYRKWFDEIFSEKNALVIVDSKTAANCLVSYNRENVKKIYFVHGAHQLHGKFVSSREFAMRSTTNFDAFVFLTKKQMEDYVSNKGGGDKCFIIPNYIESTCVDVSPRPLHSAVIIGSLVKRKQVNHAIMALKYLKEKTGIIVILNIYGDGEKKENLLSLINDEGMTDQVIFKGYSSSIRECLSKYSMILFTSSAEGFGLVLIEAMEKGCIPISYDMNYGPASIIKNGENGFLTDENPEALAYAIEKFINLSDVKINVLRKNASKRINEYSLEKIAKKWSMLCSKI